MKSKIFILAAICTLITCLSAFAEEEKVSTEEAKVSGEFTPVVQILEIDGNKSKFNEYRDLRDGLDGHIGLHYDAEEAHLDFGADDIGRKDQKYELGGGGWGSDSYYLSYDGIPHNFTLSTTLHR